MKAQLAQYRRPQYSPVPVTLVIDGQECVDYDPVQKTAKLNVHGQLVLLSRILGASRAHALLVLDATWYARRTAADWGLSHQTLTALAADGYVEAQDRPGPRLYCIDTRGLELLAWVRGEQQHLSGIHPPGGRVKPMEPVVFPIAKPGCIKD